MKLLESQLKSYHQGQDDYSFLNPNRLHNYDDLNTLFFGVLARPVNERSASVREFERVPYLNSSLFEPSELEHLTLDMSALRDERDLPLYGGTVLKDANGKRRTGSLNTLTYLFAFLDAYDFSSEGSETVQEERKTLINASVLGLIFEKINGYKDGSFFTPGFITMYMCRETVRRAVVQKFNEVRGWNCGTFDELYDKIDDKQEANAIINSVKVCDPAVGSGHFLVSALNELLSIKSELKVLLDENGKTLRDYTLEVISDELVITDSDGELFAYNPKNAESQRVQKTLFLEKQTLIENGLFGVDINPNSIKICRLRLWIELLKHAYYKADGQLETLPNIDINIKTGNSLISRFALDADLKQALKKSGHTVKSYQDAVNTYRNASSKEEKREMKRLIGAIKTSFRVEMLTNDPKILEQKRLRARLGVNQDNVFADTEAQTKEQQKEQAKIQKRLEALDRDIQEVKDNRIFEGAFEWRFEFPEVLDDNGDFTGFDVLIGNPPYVLISKREFDRSYSEFFPLMSGKPDLYRMFVEKCLELLVPNGFMSLIIPNTILTIPSASKLRQHFLENVSLSKIVNFDDSVFEEASVNSIVLDAKKSEPVQGNTVSVYQNPSPSLGGMSFDEWFSANQDDWLQNKRYEWNIFVTSETTKIFDKVMKVAKELETFTDNLSLGIQVYHNSIHTQEEIKSRYLHADHEVDKNHILELGGKNLNRFTVKENKKPVYVDYSSEKIYMKVEPKIFRQKRILLREIVADRLIAALTDEKFAVNKSCYIITLNKNTVSYEYVLGVLNSTLTGFWVSNKGDKANQKLFPRITMSTLRTLPIRTINFSDPADKQNHDAVVGLVETMLSLHEQKAATADLSERTRLEREIAAADAQLDALVYELYGLTEEEIRIVEEAGAR